MAAQAARRLSPREVAVREMAGRRREMAAKAVIGGLAAPQWMAALWEGMEASAAMDHAHGHARTMHTVMGVSTTDLGIRFMNAAANATEGESEAFSGGEESAEGGGRRHGHLNIRHPARACGGGGALGSRRCRSPPVPSPGPEASRGRGTPPGAHPEVRAAVSTDAGD